MSRRKRSPPGEEVLLTVGDTVYERIEELLPGPHGERVLLARRRAPGEPPVRVILKELSLPTGGTAPESLERALRRMEEEVRLARYLEHPGIARVHGLHARPEALTVEVEHVPGTSLDEAISLALTRQRPFTEHFLRYVGARVAAALAYANARTDERGAALCIVHRDIQPERIHITLSGEVKLVDFGVACSRLAGRLGTSVTRPHGQALYASPEVLFGEPVDGRADLFSLGLVLLELGTGLHLYDLPDMKESELEARLTARDEQRVARAGIAALEAGLHFDDYERAALHAAVFQPGDVKRLSARLPPSLRAILLRLLRRSPDERYQSAEALVADLRKRLGKAGAAYGEAEAVAELKQARREAGAWLVGDANFTHASTS